MYYEINSELEKKFKMTDFPLNIGVEVTNHCNLNCIMCNNDKMKRPKGNMSMGLYKKIIDEVALENPATRIWLDFYGEAMIVGYKLYYMVDYAKKKGLTNVCINTNATLMKPEYAEMLLDSGVDYISIDCDGFSKEVYESIRVNADRDVFYKNVEYLLEYKKKINSDTVIDVKIIEMEQNKHEVKKVVEYWRNRGAWTAVRRCAEWVAENDNPVNDDINIDRIACGTAVGTAVISWDGMVGGCAWDYDCTMKCGDINKESIKEIWMRRNDQFLKLHFEHRWNELPKMCQNCTDWRVIGEERFDENGNPVNKSYKTEEKMF